MSEQKLETQNIGMEVNVWDLVSQVIESRRDSRDVIREFLSNSAANEVQASNIKVIIYDEPEYGPSIIFSDDGIGMDYTGDMQKPGRLDKFMAVAYGGHAGYQSDEFGYKGLGSKLASNCRKLEVKTNYKQTGENYFVFVEEPIKSLRENKQPIYKVIKDAGLQKNGTEIKVLGYEYGENVRLFTKDKILTYLYFNTIIGHTKERKMPNIILKINGEEINLSTGFQYINEPNPKNWKTYTIKEQITKTISKSGKSYQLF